MNRSTLGPLVMVLVSSLAVGCGPRRDRTQTNRYETRERDALTLMVVVDLSGSFQHMMAEDGKAWELTLAAIDKYMKDRAGASEDDQLLLANISGTRRSIMWQGTQHSFRKEFKSKQAFRDYLLSHADPNGSLVNDGIAHAVEYLNAHHNLHTVRGQSVILICSDMLDNGPEPEKSEDRLLKAFVDFHAKGGIVGIYYIDQLEYAKWRKKLADAGVPTAAIECDFTGRPALPDLQ